MKLNSERILPVTIGVAWAALNDDSILMRCIPGCETLTRSDKSILEATVALAIGPVKARFKGVVRFENVELLKGYSMTFEGQGGLAGFSKGTAVVQLREFDERQTVLSYDVAAQVGGKIAQIGARLVDAAAQKITNEFFSRFTKELADAAAVPALSGEASLAAPNGMRLAR